jgi:hypothetical protein
MTGKDKTRQDRTGKDKKGKVKTGRDMISKKLHEIKLKTGQDFTMYITEEELLN